MKITVDCTRLVDRGGRKDVEELELPENANVFTMLEMLSFPKHQARFMVVMRNEKRLQGFTRVQDGDHLEIAVPLGGG